MANSGLERHEIFRKLTEMAGAQESAREETRALKILNPTKPLTAKKMQATAIFLLATAIFLLATAIFLQATAIFLQATAKKLQPNFKNSIFRARGSSRALLCAPAVSVSFQCDD